MSKGIRQFVQEWLIDNAYDLRNYAGEGETRTEKKGWLGDIAYDMKSDFYEEHGNMCPKNCNFDEWYDTFVDMFIMPILRELKRTW